MTTRENERDAHRTTRRSLVSFMSLMLLCPAVVRASDYPIRTVTLIVPFPPGGATDLLGRLIANGLSEPLGKPVVVENRAGANGSVGAGVAARATPDGHTLLLTGSPLVMEQILRADLGLDLERDLAPVALIAEGPLILVASPSLGVRDVSELLALARQKPGQLTYASVGSGSHAHLAGEMLKAAADVDLLHVPYKGGAPALFAVIGGQVAVGFITSLTVIESIKAGKVTALAVSGSKRLPTLPGVPTLAESGLSGVDLDLWAAIFVPANTPREIIARLSREIVAVVHSAEVARTIEDQGAIVVTGGPEEVSRRMRADIALTSRLVKAVNLRVND